MFNKFAVTCTIWQFDIFTWLKTRPSLIKTQSLNAMARCLVIWSKPDCAIHLAAAFYHFAHQISIEMDRKFTKPRFIASSTSHLNIDLINKRKLPKYRQSCRKLKAERDCRRKFGCIWLCVDSLAFWPDKSWSFGKFYKFWFARWWI